MKIYQRLILAFYLGFTFLSCNQTNDKKFEMMSASDSASHTISSSAALENGKDSTRKFIRTADLKFKVKSVIQSTYDIEDITNRQGGFVTFTNLTSSNNNLTSIAVSADSSLETTYFTMTNSMTLRVPNTKLDTTLKEISKNIKYLDYRIIKADDVALKILSNTLLQNRSVVSENRITNAIDNRGKKLDETTIAENVLQSKQERNDNAKISNLSLTDQINFSTINLNIYERQAVTRELVFNERNIDEYEPSLGHKIFESMKYGWTTLKALLVFLTKLWSLFLFSFLAYFFFKLFRLKLK